MVIKQPHLAKFGMVESSLWALEVVWPPSSIISISFLTFIYLQIF